MKFDHTDIMLASVGRPSGAAEVEFFAVLKVDAPAGEKVHGFLRRLFAGAERLLDAGGA